MKSTIVMATSNSVSTNIAQNRVPRPANSKWTWMFSGVSSVY